MSGRTDTRKAALLDSGTLSPNPWDLTLSRQNICTTLKALERRVGLDPSRSELQTLSSDKVSSASLPVVKGCDPSADSRAGMARGRACIAAPELKPKTPPDISLLRAKNGLDNGVHFRTRALTTAWGN